MSDVSAPPAGPPPLLNIANVLTGVRLVLVPVFLAALFVDHGRSVDWRLAAFGVFAVAAFTDRLDGELARRRGLVTAFGTVADPIADKALTGSALVGLSALGLIPWWATVVIMGREIGITLLRFAVLRHGIIPASRGGKAKTLVQAFAIGFYLLPLPELLGADTAGAWVALGAGHPARRGAGPHGGDGRRLHPARHAAAGERARAAGRRLGHAARALTSLAVAAHVARAVARTARRRPRSVRRGRTRLRDPGDGVPRGPVP